MQYDDNFTNMTANPWTWSPFSHHWYQYFHLPIQYHIKWPDSRVVTWRRRFASLTPTMSSTSGAFSTPSQTYISFLPLWIIQNLITTSSPDLTFTQHVTASGFTSRWNLLHQQLRWTLNTFLDPKHEDRCQVQIFNSQLLKEWLSVQLWDETGENIWFNVI